MRKLKFNLGEGGAKGFFIRHIEKLVMFVAIVLVALFFCLGYNVEGLPSAKTPTALKEKIERVRGHLQRTDAWGVLEKIRTPDLRHPQRVDEGRQRTDDRDYALLPFELPAVRQKTPRTDPRIYPPLRLEVVSANVPLGYFPTRSDQDLLSDKEQASPPKRHSKPGASKPKKTEKADSPGDLLKTGGGKDSDDDEDSPAGAIYGATSGPGGELRQLTQTQMAALGTQLDGNAIAKAKYLVGIKAVVPYEQQFKEFESCLANSNEYEISRDAPQYRWFFVERAEVPADPAAPLVWTPLSTKELKTIAERNWVPVMTEAADPDYLDDVLTMPTAPLLMGDLRKWALHSDVPERKELAAIEEGEEMADEPSSDDGPDAPEASDGSAPADGRPPTAGRMPYGPTTGAGAGRTGPGPATMSRPPSSTPSTRPPGAGSRGMPNPGGRGPMSSGGMRSSAGMMSSGGMRSSAGMMPSGGMMAGGMGSQVADVQLAKFKLIRFYDLKAQPGKTYRYRIKVQLFDPNHPADPAQDPSPPSLDPAVAARVKALDNKEGTERKTYFVDSEWSDPSEPITVPLSPQKLLAGAVSPAKETELRISGEKTAPAKFVEREPQAMVAASIWDEMYAATVATELEVIRGSVLNAKKSVDVLHPVTRQFHVLKDYPFVTDSVLLDIRGGEPLPGKRSDKLDAHVPGEFLLVDKYGALQVGNEFDDTDDYRQELFIEDEPPASTATSAYGGSGDGKATMADYEKRMKGAGRGGPPGAKGASPYGPPPSSGPKKGKKDEGGSSVPSSGAPSSGYGGGRGMPPPKTGRSR